MIKFTAAIVLGIALGAVSVAALTLPRLHRRYTPQVAYRDLQELLGLHESAEEAAVEPVECWGDSLTAGSTGSPGHDFPAVLHTVFHRQAINRGVAGETSGQVRARMVSSESADRPRNVVIWVGHNDVLERPDETERNIADMVSTLPHGSHYLVLGMLNKDVSRERRGGDRYGPILALNQRLSATYGTHYLPVREILVASADAASIDDAVAAKADVVPPSLRTDSLHLDDQGEAFVAVAVESAIRRGGW